jgi:8-oxo-dGTP diphosphatase
MDEIRRVDVSPVDLSAYRKQLADCVILTHDRQLYLQRRPDDWHSSPGCVTIFGGHVEAGETPHQAVVREINEETGGRIKADDLIFIGAVTEAWTNHTEIVHVYFWHDKNHTITGCYEAEPIFFRNVATAIAHSQIMDYARWALEECRERGLIND